MKKGGRILEFLRSFIIIAICKNRLFIMIGVIYYYQFVFTGLL